MSARKLNLAEDANPYVGRRIIYIAGPFRGPSNWAIVQNIRRAERLALEIWAMGHVALCPHLNTQNFQDALPDVVWLLGDLDLVARCDGVLLAHNWEKSKGSVGEMKHAMLHGIPVFRTLSELRRSFGSQQMAVVG